MTEKTQKNSKNSSPNTKSRGDALHKIGKMWHTNAVLIIFLYKDIYPVYIAFQLHEFSQFYFFLSCFTSLSFTFRQKTYEIVHVTVRICGYTCTDQYLVFYLRQNKDTRVYVTIHIYVYTCTLRKKPFGAVSNDTRKHATYSTSVSPRAR